MNNRALVGHIAAKFGVIIKDDDPSFIVAEMTRVILESMVESTSQEWEKRFVDINDKLTSTLGAIAGSIDEMNVSADDLVQRKLIDLNNQVNGLVGVTIKKQIETSLAEAVDTEIKKVRLATDDIAKNVRDMKNRSLRSQFGAMAGASFMGALLAFGVMWYAIYNGKVYVPGTPAPAVAHAEPIKQVQRNR